MHKSQFFIRNLEKKGQIQKLTHFFGSGRLEGDIIVKNVTFTTQKRLLTLEIH